jgi:phospholipid/cholesterol/gamma-HCH transport system ATP-binding protein
MTEPHITVRGLTLGYGDRVVLRDLDFEIERGKVFVLMGGSGCGKSTVLRALIGLLEPVEGEIRYGSFDFTKASPEERQGILRRIGVLYQSGALWSSMTLAENVGLPLGEYTRLKPDEIREVAALKLALVGLRGFEDYYPAEISGGMQKRAGLARAIALDPDVLFLDEPSAGLDPVTSRMLDDLILELRDSLGATFVVVTHELASIFTIADDSLFLDAETRTGIARGHPKELLEKSKDPKVRRFLTRGSEEQEGRAGV